MGWFGNYYSSAQVLLDAKSNANRSWNDELGKCNVLDEKFTNKKGALLLSSTVTDYVFIYFYIYDTENNMYKSGCPIDMFAGRSWIPEKWYKLASPYFDDSTKDRYSNMLIDEDKKKELQLHNLNELNKLVPNRKYIIMDKYEVEFSHKYRKNLIFIYRNTLTRFPHLKASDIKEK